MMGNIKQTDDGINLIKFVNKIEKEMILTLIKIRKQGKRKRKKGKKKGKKNKVK